MRWRAIALALLCAPSAASADDLSSRLNQYESEVQQISSELLSPTSIGVAEPKLLVDGIIAFDLGDYQAAAVILLPLASAPPSVDRETAVFYLAETLYHQGDLGGAQTYFTQIADGKNLGSARYQPALVRLVEIAIAQHESAEQPIALLDQISPSQRIPTVTYAKAKAAFAADKYDDALAFLADVPKGSELEMQVAYYTGTVYVAKKDLVRATEIYTDLISKKPRTSSDRRVIELGEMALGRLFYERDQFSKSIDSYLLIDRHSDLFPDALYEVAWVYVKNKQFDKALSALDLLAKSDVQSTKTPTVRLLEANLHMRKAQLLRASLIAGTIESEKIDPGVEYDLAAKMFDDVHVQYTPSYASLTALIESNSDPSQFIAQIADRKSPIFRTTVPIPEAAAQLLRDEPEVHRIATVETDLGDIQADLDTSAATIERLEGVLAANDKTNLYPLLANKRARVIQVEEDLIKVRNDLAEQQLKLVTPSGELPQLTEKRRALADQYTKLGNAEQAYVDRRTAERAEYDRLDGGANEIDAAMGAAQAMAVAIRKFEIDMPDSALPAETKAAATTQLDAEGKEAESIEKELTALHRELELGRDLTGVGDAQIVAARALRQELMVAQDVELHALAGFASASQQPSRSSDLSSVAARASRVIDQLRITEVSIDKKVDQGVTTVRTQLATEQANLAAYRNELAVHEAESKNLSTTLLASAFREVKAKIYDIVVRADVGTIDTSWSQKSDTDDDLKRLNLSRAREMKQLKDEFRDILEANVAKPSEKKPVSDMPAANLNAPVTSPDKGGNTRVNPIGGSPTGGAPATPTVKPDPAMKGGSK